MIKSKIIVVLLSLFLAGCELVQLGIYMLKPFEPVDIPMVFGEKIYTAEFTNYLFTTPYVIGLRTKFLNDKEYSLRLFNEVEDYPRQFSIKLYLIGDNHQKVLIEDQKISEKSYSWIYYFKTAKDFKLNSKHEFIQYFCG